MCKYFNWSCPTVPCDELQTYCEMQQIQDDQCSMNRGGPLCTECKANYSFTFDALECVDTDTCSAGNFILNLFINIVFLVVIIVGLLLILRLNLRVGSGYMYSFLYYFSVVEFLLPGTISSSFLNVLVINIASFTQLNQVPWTHLIVWLSTVQSTGTYCFELHSTHLHLTGNCSDKLSCSSLPKIPKTITNLSYSCYLPADPSLFHFHYTNKFQSSGSY